MPRSHRWSCCQLHTCRFCSHVCSVRHEKPISFSFNPKPPSHSPLSNNLQRHTCTLSNGRKMEHHQKYILAFRGHTETWYELSQQDFVPDSLSESQIQVVLQSEYFGVDGVQLLSGGRFCLCRPFISVLLIIPPPGRGVQKHRRDGCCIKTKFFNSEFTLVVESFFFNFHVLTFNPQFPIKVC